MPTIVCKGLCWRTCGTIPLTQLELDYVKTGMVLPRDDLTVPMGPTGLLLTGEDARCPLLVDGRCSVHPVRPFICRAYGVVNDPQMTCEFGCIPERLLDNKEVEVLLDEIAKLDAEAK